MNTFIYSMDIQQALDELDANASLGLSEAQAAVRLAQSAKSRPAAPKEKPLILRIFGYFKDIPVVLLIAAAVVYAMISGNVTDAAIIVATILTCMAIEVAATSRAGKAARALGRMSRAKTRVRREDQIISIDACNAVVGDIVILGKGDCVPADIRLIKSVELRVDESAVTGEAQRARKDANAVLDTGAPVGDRRNLAYMGSIITRGRGEGVVYAVGTDTEIYKRMPVATATEETVTPLQHKLSAAAKTLGMLCIIVCVLVAVIGILYDALGVGEEPRGVAEMLVTSLALIRVTIPKWMAIAATVIIATGAYSMAKSYAISKNLDAALMLGHMTVICTGKTGTLTRNMMVVTRVADSETVYEVTGVGYKSKGHVVAEIMITRNIALMSEIAVLCNDASYDKKNARITGDPTEGAMLVFGAKLGHDKQALNAARPRVREIPFDPVRKMMSTYNSDGERIIMYTKGAAEEIINRSSYVYLDGEIVFMSDAVRVKLMAQNERFAGQALRVLAFAYKVYGSERNIDNVEQDLIYVGMMGIENLMREEIVTAVRQYRGAGIGVKMITGDHRRTAGAIALASGIITGDDEILDAGEIDALNEEQLCERVKTANVFARVTPELKVRIISALKAEKDSTVALIGNKADDVPAIEKADIGIAMDAAGCDIAKEKAGIVIRDNRFDSIINAVANGRTIYANIRKAVSYVLACNIAILLTVFVTTAFSLPVPFTPVQLLFINLLAGMTPVLAIGMEKNEIGVLTGRPRNPEESVMNRGVINLSVARAVFMFAASFAAYLYGMYVVVAPEEIDRQTIAASMCLFTLAAGQLCAAYSSKTGISMGASGTIFRNGYLNACVLLSLIILIAAIYMPGLNGLLSVVPLSAGQVVICGVLIVLTIVGFELSKLYSRH